MDRWAGRPRPPFVGDERAVLDGWLDFHRATLLWKCEGLTDEQLKSRAVPTSGLTLLGLVRHMIEVERGWFLPFLGEYVDPVYGTDEDPDAEFDVTDADASADVERFRAEVDALRTRLAGHDLDETEVGEEKSYSLRWIYTHMIEEYARHNGHADLLREAVDGARGE